MDDGDDDQYWKFGVFYVNPRDPRILVPKRLGLGRTLNYGHPIAWVVTVVLLIVVALLVAHRHGAF